MRDHFSKFSWAYPLVSKRASEVAEKLVDIFSLFRVNYIFCVL